MPIISEQQVFGLQVSVDDAHVVQILEAKSDLGNIKLGTWLGELFFLLKVREKLTAVYKVCERCERMKLVAWFFFFFFFLSPPPR